MQLVSDVNKAGQTIEQAFEATLDPTKSYSEASMVTLLRNLFKQFKELAKDKAETRPASAQPAPSRLTI